MEKALGEPVHKRLLVIGEPIGIGGVDGWEIHIAHFVSLAVGGHSAVGVVDFVQKQVILHTEFGVRAQKLTLELELDNRNRLVDFRPVEHVVLRQVDAFGVFRDKAGARVVRVGFERKDGQRAHIYAVAVLKAGEIAVFR